MRRQWNYNFLIFYILSSIALILVVLFTYLSYQYLQVRYERATLLRESQELVKNLYQLSTNLVEAVLYSEKYAETKNPAYKNNLNQKINKIYFFYNKSQSHIVNGDTLSAQLNAYKLVLDKTVYQLNTFTNSIDNPNIKNLKLSLTPSIQQNLTMIDRLVASETQVLNKREAEFVQSRRDSSIILWAAAIFCYILLLTAFISIRRIIKINQYEKANAIKKEMDKIKLEFALEAAELGTWELNMLTGDVKRNLKHDQIFGYQTLVNNWTYEKFKKHVHPDDLSFIDTHLEKATRFSDTLNIQFRIYHPDGTLHWLHSRAKTFRTGNIITVIGIVEDITEKKIVEERLQFLKNILHSSIEHSIIPLDLNWNILSWNQGAKNNYGYEDHEIIGHSVHELHIPEDIQSGRTEQFLGQVVTEGKATGIFERMRKNGERFTASVVVVASRNTFDKVIGYLLISKNITEQEKLLQQYEASNKELEQFAYVASHDLKAPLRSIQSLISWIMKDDANVLSAESKENLQLLNKRVIRMSNLIEGILQYSRVGHSDMEITTVSIKELIKEIIETLNPPANFTITYPNDLPTIQAFKVPLSQVFANLINNGIKFHDKPQGHITIGYKELEKFYEFSVSDDGPGIEPEYHQKIFEVFQTLQSRDTIESTGIGLSIVKKIVESQGGRITVASEKGQGSTFTFTYPKKLIPPKKTPSRDSLFGYSTT